MTAPRIEIDVDAIAHNARTLVDRLAVRDISVTGVTKACLAMEPMAAALLRGGVSGLGDSRIENLERLRASPVGVPLTLIRSPMLSQVASVVELADRSLNTEGVVLDALSAAAAVRGVVHEVVLMVELGDLREGIAIADVTDVARTVSARPGLRLVGLGANLACQSGIIPSQTNMDQLSSLVDHVEAACGHELSVVSAGNSANLDWALSTGDVGRVNELRLGESILLGTEPLYRTPIDGLRTDAFTLVAEVIEVQYKPAQAWGSVAQTAFGTQPPRIGTGTVHQAILAIGHQDVDPAGVVPPTGMCVLGASSDHLVLDVADHDVAVGNELSFGVDYSALLRSMSSPFVAREWKTAAVCED